MGWESLVTSGADSAVTVPGPERPGCPLGLSRNGVSPMGTNRSQQTWVGTVGWF